MIRKLKSFWLLIPVIVTLTISSSLVYNSNWEDAYFVTKTSAVTTLTPPSFSLASIRHVTKSLSELGKMDDINKYVLFFNNVPNSGGEILILLLQRLQGFNSYKHIRLKGRDERKLSRLKQEQFVDEMYNIMRTEAVPLSFDRHLYFINFDSFDKQSPTYVNLLRDPVERLTSRSAFKNKSKLKKYLVECLDKKNQTCDLQKKKLYDPAIPYFCGHDSRCGFVNDPWALQQAKSNIEKFYPVVGILEELNTTVRVLEAKIPYFFKGAREIYATHVLDKYNASKNRRKLNDKVIEKQLRRKLHAEYEFYEWTKQRLLQQIKSV